MEQIKEFVKSIWSLETDQIAIISLVITLLLFVLGKRSENKIKMYETRKEEYKKLIDFFVKVFASAGKDVEKLAKNDTTKNKSSKWVIHWQYSVLVNCIKHTAFTDG